MAAIDHPDLLAQYDVFGDSFEKSPQWGDTSIARGFIYSRHRSPPPADTEISIEQRLQIRRNIVKTGIQLDWQAIVHSDYDRPMPFDEPTLAILGMWTMGGGPNPHFALALGEIMQSVGQRAIAWNAYERAVELHDSFWPDAAIRTAMVKLCHDQQDAIAAIESPDDAANWQKNMREQHQKELQWGIASQQAYQDFEAKQISAGVALDDPNFYTEFFKGRPPIASNPGLSDDLLVRSTDVLPSLMLGLGLGMALALVLPEKHLS